MTAPTSASLLAQPLMERNRYSAKLEANPCSFAVQTGKVDVRNEGNSMQPSSSCGPRVGSSVINDCTSRTTGGRAKAKNRVAAAATLSNSRKIDSPRPGCQRPMWMPHNASDHRGENHREQGAYVEQQKDLAHQVSDRNTKATAKAKRM
jgi:hypothetical protein